MSQSSPLCMGMAVHQDAIAVAYVAPDHGAEGIDLGTSGTRQGDSDQLIRQRHSQANPPVLVSEAGPCGDGLYRELTKKGDDGWVVAPALMPNKAGDRVNTARRDAVPLARLARSGELPAVQVPQVEDDAIRELTRARADPIRDLKDAQFRLNAFWLRHDLREVGRANWGPAHLRWRSAVVCPTPAQHSVFQAQVRAVNEHTARLQRLEQARHEHVQAWRVHPVVEALQALPGVPFPVAVTLVAERGDLTRVETPRARMQLMGLIPSAYSSGEPRRQGSLTTAGNTHARRVLVAGAWAYRSPAKVSRQWPLRLAQQPNIIQDIRWKAPVRLCKRYRRLLSRGQHAPVVTVAMARELTGLLGAIAKEVPVTPSDHDGSRLYFERSRVPTCIGRGAAPVWCPPRQREAAGTGDSSLERGRHPTDARQVVAHPRIAAGSTVDSYWLRLFRCTEVKKTS